MEFIIEIEPETQWLAPWSGDPGRTCIKENAKRYKTKKAAQAALSRAMNRYSFRSLEHAKIISV